VSGGDGDAGGDGMIKLEKCPHCGSDVILCKMNGMAYVAYEFSIVCPGCGLETKMTVNPNANCCFDMGEAVNQMVEKWNRRENQP
jgi:hypothetical protein